MILFVLLSFYMHSKQGQRAFFFLRGGEGFGSTHVNYTEEHCHIAEYGASTYINGLSEDTFCCSLHEWSLLWFYDKVATSSQWHSCKHIAVAT